LIIDRNRVFKDWPEIFNNDNTLTSALPDRLLHHTVTVVIEGKSYRMKGTIENGFLVVKGRRGEMPWRPQFACL